MPSNTNASYFTQLATGNQAKRVYQPTSYSRASCPCPSSYPYNGYTSNGITVCQNSSGVPYCMTTANCNSVNCNLY